MKTIDLASLESVTGGKQSAYVKAWSKGFDQASSWCPPANTNAGWNCRLAAGSGAALGIPLR